MEAHQVAATAERGTPGARVRGTWRGTRRVSEYARTKPEGGFCFIPAMAVIAAWWAYKRGIIGLVDLRVWLAMFEAVARRCVDRGNCRPRFVEHEIAALVGTSVEHARGSIRVLERAGFLRWSETAVYLGNGIARLSDEQCDDLRRMTAQVRNHRRKVPVPRRVLRLLSRSKRPVLMATVLGHLLRCVYYRDGKCAPDGRCKSSWIADVFEVDVRNVKAARRELVGAGLLVMERTDQRSMNHWGPRVRFNFDWQAPPRVPSPSPPRPTDLPRQLPPPREDRELASRVENQKPARAGRVGAARRWRVATEDLGEPKRLQGLFDRLVRLGVCRAGEASRLAFFATAARAVRVATVNAAGLLATLVRRGLWSYATLADEDRARSWLRPASTSAAASPSPVDSGTWLKSPGESRNHAPEAVAAILARVLPAAGALTTNDAGTVGSRGADGMHYREVARPRNTGSAGRLPAVSPRGETAYYREVLLSPTRSTS